MLVFTSLVWTKKECIFFIERVSKLVKLATLVKDDLKAPFSIAPTLQGKGGRNSIPRIAPLYF